MQQEGKRIGILGGTFDPVHNGHLALATAAWRCFSLDEVLFIPAASPPHKPERHLASFAQRLAMLELALADYPCFRVSKIEQERKGPSYTLDTLIMLKRRLPPGTALFFIVGSDAFASIKSWYSYKDLFLHTNFLVGHRPELSAHSLAQQLQDDPEFCRVDCNASSAAIPVAIQQVQPTISRNKNDPTATIATGNNNLLPWRHYNGGLVYPCPVDALPISSSDIRARVRAALSLHELLPCKVESYIHTNGVYLKDEQG